MHEPPPRVLADTHRCVPGSRQVPVGGAIVAAPRSSTYLVEAVNKAYPGRASASPSLDLFMTLLHWGASGTAWQCSACKLLMHTLLNAMSAVQCAPPKAPVAGWQEALQQREALFLVLLSRLREFAERNGVSSPQCHSLTEGAERFCGTLRCLLFNSHHHAGERVLDTPSNPISIGVTLQRLSSSARPAASESGTASMLGSMLFNRCSWPQQRGRQLHVSISGSASAQPEHPLKGCKPGRNAGQCRGPGWSCPAPSSR